MIHTNSITAYKEDSTQLSKRAQEVLDFLVRNYPSCFTDRQIQQELGYAERGQVQPRCSDLVRLGLAQEMSFKSKCELTGKHVRLLRKMPEDNRQQMQLAI